MCNIIFIDLCGTLVNENTTFHFFEKKILPKKNLCIKLIWKLKIVQIITKLSFLLGIKWDLSKKACLFFMKGLNRNDLAVLSDEFVNELSWRKDILTKIDLLKRHGYFPVIISASLDFLVKSVSKKMHIDKYESSLLLYNNDRFSGVLYRDLQGNKKSVIMSYSFSKSIFFTDNLDDSDCIDSVNYFIAVTSRKNLNFWKRNRVFTHVV
ncbi:MULTISPECIES: haloacid dehalogenase-like hydrolase [Arsenophonus]|uniref:haloacid dehalogenase-like hydrolase n=1 Tax=Arsenophonus TaxID=637 RepID=UPI0015D70F03|nr:MULTISPECIES: haloacid dehalogenase-like hydrolase [Arsenophonus]UBX29219.1 hypothetical protein LDL57_00455 [Arsenophonus apicola]